MSVAKYLLHGKRIIFIDEIIEFKSEFIRTRGVIKPDNIYLENKELPTYKSIEIMAQSLGIYQGKMAELLNKKPQLGFLLGARKFEIFIPSLKVADVIEVKATQSLQDASGFGVYDCELFANSVLAARARVNVLSPDENMLSEMMNA